MKLNVLALTVVASVFGVAAANAQTTVIKEGPPDKTVIIKKHKPDVVVRKKVITTGSSDCSSKIVHRDTPAGSTTVKRTNCD
jgi:hypothetical protein